MNFRNDPFFDGAAPPSVFPAHFGFTGTSGSELMRRHREHHHAMALSPFGGGGGMLMPFGGGPSPFSMMNQMMMHNMDSMMRNSMQRPGEGGHCYSSSSTTVMSYSSDGRGGQPQMYQATTSTRQGPGGVKETRKAVKDSQSGLQKMAVGHHIGEKSHVIERRMNTKTGERAEHQEYVNLDESEADAFGDEWKEKTHTLNNTSSFLPNIDSTRHNHFAESRGLPSTSTSRPRNHLTPKSTRVKLSPKSSPYVVHKPKPVHPRSHTSYPHSDRYQTLPQADEVPPTTNEEEGGTRQHKKKGGEKKTTFADP